MSGDVAVYGGGKFCGTCGIRVDGECTLPRAKMERCLVTPGRPHWRKLATDREKLQEFLEAGKVVAQCTEQPDTIKKNDHDVDVDEMVKYDPKSRYYDHGGIEVLDIIKAKLTPEQYQGFCLGNAIKYTCRANHKGDYDRDLEKAEFYTREAR